MPTITTADHEDLLRSILRLHGLPEESLVIVPDVAKAATDEGFLDATPDRLAKVLRVGGITTFWIKATIDEVLQALAVQSTRIRLVGEASDLIEFRLSEASSFVAFLLLHEIGHTVLFDRGEADSEEAVDRWAWEQLIKGLRP